MHRSWILSFVPLLVACGPSEGEPMEASTGDTGSGTATVADASTSTSSASGGVETSTAADETTSASEDTAALPEELPPEAAGGWLCEGWEDPIFIRLDIGTSMPWEGTACGPDISTNPPHEWTICDELGFGHTNLTFTQAYWTFELNYGPVGGSLAALDLGVSYMPDTDTLEGFIRDSNGQGPLIPETCTRYVEE